MTTTQADTWGLHESQFWLRGQQPEERVHHAEELGFWNVYGHPEAEEVLRDPATYSSDTTRLIPKEMIEEQDVDLEAMSAGNLLQLDPPLHNKMRKLVSRAFTPKVVADLEPRIAAVTNEMLDAAGGDGRLELVEDLAYPLPVIVIAELLGVPASDRHLFKGWVDKLFSSSEQFSLKEQSEARQEAVKKSLEGQKALVEYLGEHVDERRKQPREDLLTKLVEAELDGEKLTRNEVVNFANVLLLAGHITTTMLLGNAVLCLDTHRGVGRAGARRPVARAADDRGVAAVPVAVRGGGPRDQARGGAGRGDGARRPDADGLGGGRQPRRPGVRRPGHLQPAARPEPAPGVRPRDPLLHRGAPRAAGRPGGAERPVRPLPRAADDPG